MRNKGFVVVLAAVITALCIYYLSFTYVSQGIQKDAVEYARDETGTINLVKKQIYLDSVWNQPVYNLFGAEFTYKEIKENELSRGLDLQGGMHVVLEVSPADIIRGLSDNNSEPEFIEALRKAREMQKNSQERFSALFLTAYKETSSGKNLAPLFATASTRGRVSLADSDDQIMTFLNDEIESAIDRSFTILKPALISLEHLSPIFSAFKAAEFKLKFPVRTILSV